MYKNNNKTKIKPTNFMIFLHEMRSAEADVPVYPIHKIVKEVALLLVVHEYLDAVRPAARKVPTKAGRSTTMILRFSRWLSP